MNTLAQAVLTALVGVFLPMLVGLATRWVTTSAAKGFLLAALSLLSGLLTDILANPNLNLVKAAAYALITWALGVATHFGLWKPVKVTAEARRARAY